MDRKRSGASGCTTVTRGLKDSLYDKNLYPPPSSAMIAKTLRARLRHLTLALKRDDSCILQKNEYQSGIREQVQVLYRFWNFESRLYAMVRFVPSKVRCGGT